MQYLWLGLMAAAIWTFVIVSLCETKTARARIADKAVLVFLTVFFGGAANALLNEFIPGIGTWPGILIGIGYFAHHFVEINKKYPITER